MNKTMSTQPECKSDSRGIEMLIKRYKNMFSVPENINYYSEEDYREAERKFVRYALNSGKYLLK